MCMPSSPGYGCFPISLLILVALCQLDGSFHLECFYYEQGCTPFNIFLRAFCNFFAMNFSQTLSVISVGLLVFCCCCFIGDIYKAKEACVDNLLLIYLSALLMVFLFSREIALFFLSKIVVPPWVKWPLIIAFPIPTLYYNFMFLLFL